MTVLKLSWIFFLTTLSFAEPIIDNANRPIGDLPDVPPTTCWITVNGAVTSANPGGRRIVQEGDWVTFTTHTNPPGWTKTATIFDITLGSASVTVGPTATKAIIPPGPPGTALFRDINYVNVGVGTGMFNTARCSAYIRVMAPPCRYDRKGFCEVVGTVLSPATPIGLGCPQGPGRINTIAMPDSWCMDPKAASYAPCLLIILAPCWPDGSHCPAFSARIINPGTVACFLQMPFGLRWESCFAPETKIRLSNGLWKKASEMTGGDEVFNPVTGKTLKVTGVIAGKEKPALYEIHADNHKLRVTETHPLMTKGGPKQAQFVRIGELIMTGNGEWKPIEKIGRSYLGKGEEVYNFRFDIHHSKNQEDHWMVAEGIAAADYTLQNSMNQTVPETFDMTWLLPLGEINK